MSRDILTSPMISLVLLMCAALPQDSDPESLKKFEQETVKKKEPRQDQPKSKSEPEPRSQSSSYDDDDEGFFDFIWDGIAELFVEVVSLPFRHAFSDQGLRFDEYPYASGSRKYFLDDEDSMKGMGVEIGLQVGRMEYDLWSIGIDGTVRLASGCDFSFNYTSFQERTDDGTDHLSLQYYALDFGAAGEARTHHVSIGAGFAIIGGEESTDVGPVVQVDFIHFPARPFSLKWHFGLMYFSEATVTDLSLDLGLHFDRFAVTLGIRSLISSDGEDLTGPTLGVAIFF